MRQVLHSLSDGRTVVSEVPSPRAASGGLLIRTTRSLISSGTERMLIDFGRAGWVERARQQPQRVRQVLEKVRTDGLTTTIEAVRSKLDQPLALGYCNVGVLTEAGRDVIGFRSGERIVSNGPHAEMVAVPRNLCARVPDLVSDDEAAFTVVGAIALQGVRLAAPTLGERFAVTGLGLIGLMTVQLLQANGCRVLGIDLDPAKRALARKLGAEAVCPVTEDPLAAAQQFTGNRGLDGVLITAATSSNEPISQGAQMCRQRGRMVLVGVTGLDLDRAEFYQKELSLQVSCSYGPGRYDAEYEEKGHDYPFGLIRWTEQRNFEAILDVMAAGKLDVKPLITHRFDIERAAQAYDLLANGSEPYLGILLDYPEAPTNSAPERTIRLDVAGARRSGAKRTNIAFIGSGNYAARILIPAFISTGASVYGVASAGGASAARCGRKFGASIVTTDSEALIGDAEVDAIVIATRHDTHARLLSRTLLAGKHVFVEKPLALSTSDLQEIREAWTACQSNGTAPLLAVGFNRRFAPQIVRMKQLLDTDRGPKCFAVTVNAGRVAPAHWTQDPHVGGGRVVGECCHFIDLVRFLAGSPIVDARVQVLGRGSGLIQGDSVSISLALADGSWSTINYVANGNPGYPKERVEVFCSGRVLQLDNFRRLTGYGWRGFRKLNLWKQDKGQKACAQAFVDAIRSGGPAPIPFEELMEVSKVSIDLAEASRC